MANSTAIKDKFSPEELEIIKNFRLETRSCLLQSGPITEKDINSIVSLIPIQSIKKGTLLLKEGEVCETSYSVIKGCIRQYYLINGEEKTTFFYTEGQSIYAVGDASNRKPAKHYLSCEEDCILTVMTRKNQNDLYQKFPHFEPLSRMGLEEELRNYQEMLASYITTSPEERYSNLLKYRPELLQRVPHHQLASYIGIKPESLSRIRKRIMQKQ